VASAAFSAKQERKHNTAEMGKVAVGGQRRKGR